MTSFHFGLLWTLTMSTVTKIINYDTIHSGKCLNILKIISVIKWN